MPTSLVGSRPCTTVASFNDFRGVCFGATAFTNFVAFGFMIMEDRGTPVQIAHTPKLLGPSKPSSLVRFLPVSQYLLELTSGVWCSNVAC